MKTVLGRNFYHMDKMTSNEFDEFMFVCRDSGVLRELYELCGSDYRKKRIKQFL